MAIPMLADFAVRLAGGLAVLLLLTPWRVVPPLFFRTHCQIILGLWVLAALDLGRASADPASLVVAVSAGVLAFLGSLAWGLGLVRVGIPLTALLAAAALLLVIGAGPGLTSASGIIGAAGRVCSAFLLGSTLTAMLLGHHYLTAPAMSIEPLRRFVRLMAAALSGRAVLAAIALAIWYAGSASRGMNPEPLFLMMRWGMGILGPAVATTLAWKTVEIRSTQSATGILYIAMTLVLFGEVSSLVLARETGATL